MEQRENLQRIYAHFHSKIDLLELLEEPSHDFYSRNTSCLKQIYYQVISKRLL